MVRDLLIAGVLTAVLFVGWKLLPSDQQFFTLTGAAGVAWVAFKVFDSWQRSAWREAGEELPEPLSGPRPWVEARTVTPAELPVRRWVLGALGMGGAACVALAALALTGAAVPDHGGDVLDLDAVRSLAGGPGPRVLRAVEVSSGTQRGLFLRAGGGLGHHDMPVYPVELAWGTGRTVLLEPATDAACSEPFLPILRYDPAAYERMQAAMLRADAIVATHEHFDHVCGLTQSPHLEALAPKALLTPEQLDGTAYMTGVDDRTRALVTPFVLDAPEAIAPGVVLIPVAGHTPGSLWIYVRTEAGAEWLFVGDTVWTGEALNEARPKPRMIGWVGGEDGARQGRLLRTLLDLQAREPEVGILIAHDAPRWEALLEDGVFERL